MVERRPTETGELVLRRAGEHFEVICDGQFVMDTRDGRSERALVREALAGLAVPRLLLAGLGVGFSLDEALATPGLREVVVAEASPDVVRWARTHLAGLNRRGLDDPRARLVVGDVGELLRREEERFDAVCLDVDNGPDWLLRPANAGLYQEPGLRLIARRLRPKGRLAVWAAAASPAFEARLRGTFHDVRRVDIPVARGPDDVVYVASGPREGPSPSTRSHPPR